MNEDAYRFLSLHPTISCSPHHHKQNIQHTTSFLSVYCYHIIFVFYFVTSISYLLTTTVTLQLQYTSKNLLSSFASLFHQLAQGGIYTTDTWMKWMNSRILQIQRFCNPHNELSGEDSPKLPPDHHITTVNCIKKGERGLHLKL
jgi:hypothetical protein